MTQTTPPLAKAESARKLAEEICEKTYAEGAFGGYVLHPNEIINLIQQALTEAQREGEIIGFRRGRDAAAKICEDWALSVRGGNPDFHDQVLAVENRAEAIRKLELEL
jgi:hypothetical protein